MSQESNVIARESLDIPSNLYEIILQIEKSTDESVIFCSDISSYHEGASCITGGIPTVYLSLEGKRPITICHELLHLICGIQGYPRTKTLHGDGEYTKGLIKFTLEFVQATIEHQVIHPQMVDLGYDPYTELERKTREGILSNLSQNPYEKVDETKLNRHYQWLHDILRPLAELDSEYINEKIRKRTKVNCPVALGKAEMIASLIKKQKNWKQAVCKAVLVDSINILGIPPGTYEIFP